MDAVPGLAMKLRLDGPNLSWVPESPDVLYFVILLPPGSSESIYVTVPTTPGEYEFV